MIAPNGNELLKVGSHRANDKLIRLIGSTQNWYSYKHSGYLVECPQASVEEALKITGITRSRSNIEHWHKCWGDFTTKTIGENRAKI